MPQLVESCGMFFNALFIFFPNSFKAYSSCLLVTF